eukprot:621061-Pyramimonas_sp.AAC.1
MAISSFGLSGASDSALISSVAKTRRAFSRVRFLATTSVLTPMSMMATPWACWAAGRGRARAPQGWRPCRRRQAEHLSRESSLLRSVFQRGEHLVTYLAGASAPSMETANNPTVQPS